MSNMKEIQYELDENRTTLNGLKLFVNVYNLAASLAIAIPYTNEKGQYCEKVRYLDDLESIGLEYQDLIDALEAQGAINMSGFYSLSPKIATACNKHKDVILALFDTFDTEDLK